MWSTEAGFSLSTNTRFRVTEVVDTFLKRQDLGFLKEERIREAIDKCKKHSGFFKDKEKLVIIGLGGSSLGIKALCQGLLSQWNNKLFFLDNVDARWIDEFLDSPFSWDKVAWLVISKSGETMETLCLYNYCYRVIHQKTSFLIDKNTAVITEQKESPLYNFAMQKQCPLLPIPNDIGGRFSVFTSVGLFPMTFAGLPLQDLKSGFHEALNNRNEVIKMAGQLWESHLREEVNFYCFQYCERLEYWSLWLQQLWSESLSKAKDRRGQPGPINSTLIPCRGVSDQHSVFQQIIEGREKKFVCFHRIQQTENSLFKMDQNPIECPLMERKGLGELFKAEMLATRETIQESGCKTMTLTTQKLTAKSLSYLMGVWFLTVGTLGELLDINVFDQPGVESGKRQTRRVLSQFH